MGTPPNSLNCLVGDFLLDFAAEGGAMRVPRPAAGTMTNTFIRGDQYSTGIEFSTSPRLAVVSVQHLSSNTGRGVEPYSTARSMTEAVGFFPGSEAGATLPGIGGTIAGGKVIAGELPLVSWRPDARSSHLPKIIFPAVVCRTEVTEMSMVLPIILRALSMTTIVPSSR